MSPNRRTDIAGLAPESAGSNAAFRKQLNKVYAWYTGGFFVFVVTLAILEQFGLPKAWVGYIFLFATVMLYAGIGIMSRTNDAAEYYVAGRRVPAVYNGMAGTLYLTGVDFSIGIFLGLAGILVCSFLGGMRAVTWTQVAQYIILIIAYMIPVVWLSVKQTGVPIPQVVYGYQLQKVTEREKQLIDDPKEKEVIAAFQAQAAALGEKLKDVPAALAADRAAAKDAWTKVDPALLSVTDVNKDGIFQLGEMRIGGDIIVLATPEIAGLPYVVSGMVAAGGLAAALSTADGLLLTIANALSHDLYYKMMDPNAPTSRRVMISKVLLLVVALMAAYVAAQKPADILFLVSAAFSLAAAGFFPALTLGIFWKRATKWGAILGMIAGFGITFYYMATSQPWLRSVFGVTDPVQLWWGIQPISAGIFGVPVGFLLPRSLLPRPGRGGPAWAV